jgi:phosphoribosylformylglycinamidine synthase II
MAEILTDTTVPDPPDDELLHRVGLTRDEYHDACRKLGRKPNVVELGIFGAMWSEHCCYKSSKRYLATLPVTGKRVLQGPGENAGVMDLGGDYAVVFKIESHNHPSAVEPFQGAATGVGGIIRDIFAMGARPIALLDSLRFGNLREISPVCVAEDDVADDAADVTENVPAEPEPQSGVVIPWHDEPKPFVCTVAWLTNLRLQLLERGPAAKQAVDEIRQLHRDVADVLAYCVLPDQILLALLVRDGGEEKAALVVNTLKANLAPLGQAKVKRDQPVWEAGYRLHQKFDQVELDEAIKRLEYTPVQRGLVKQVKEYHYVSQVWRYGEAWPEEGAELSEVPQAIRACAGVTAAQAARNRFLLSGVVSGIAHYGNCIGIPTVGGEVAFDPSYSSNCLVNPLCVGVIKKDKLIKGMAHGPGNTALIVGAKTGRDGVQGATFASVDLPEDYAKERPAVQVGDPFMEKLLLEATLEIRGKDGLIGLQDFGAAGLTCSSVEMAARAKTGMRLDLDQVPQRAKDLSAYEMMLSESQERMMVIVERGKEEPFLNTFKKWGLTAVPCGEVLKDKRLVVTHRGEEVANLPNVPLADQAPDYDRPVEVPEWFAKRKPLSDVDVHGALGRAEEQPEPTQAGGHELPASESRYESLLRRLLKSPGIACKYPVWQQYDHMVRTNTILGPGLADAAVLRIKETGQGLAVATDGSGRHVLLDPRLGAARAVLESARNVIATGAEPLGITNCLNFGNPEKPDRMWQFAETIRGMRESLGELNLPVTGGNVSFYNESGGRPILPTPVIGMVGLLEKAESYIPNRVDQPGMELYVLGECDGRLDGSSLMFELGRTRVGTLAEHNYRAFRECQRLLLDAARQQSLNACHDISDGGLLTALVEMCAGASIELEELLPEVYDNEEHNLLAALFGEEGHRWLIAADQKRRGWVRTAALHYAVPLIHIGTTTEAVLRVKLNGEQVMACPWEPLAQLRLHGLADALKD